MKNTLSKMLMTVLTIALVALTMAAAPADAHRRQAPQKLHAVASSHRAVKLDWKTVSGAKAYRVQVSAKRSMKHSRFVQFKASKGTVRHLKPGHRYFFRVRVVNPHTGKPVARYARSALAHARTKAVSTPAASASMSGPSSTPAPGVSTGPANVKAASFNISGVNNDGSASGDFKVWRDRRPVVASQILSEGADVVGLQEANMSLIYADRLDYGVTQYDDLLGAINSTGAHYALTNDYSYNCEKSTSSQNCVPVYRGASNSTRILYNTDTLDLVDAGSMRYTHQTAGKIDRYLAWGVFRVKATGGEFFFADTHLDSYETNQRLGEWNEMIAKIQQLANGRPVISVGDFNTSKYDDWAADYLPEMKADGFGDVLNQQYASSLADHPRAESMVNQNINSFNGYRRDVSDYSYSTSKPGTHIGNNIDWVFASNNLEVKQWKTVINYNPTTMQINGVIPSDHNMVDATLVIP